VLHFRKLGQQRKKIINENEGSRPTKYIKSRESILSFDTTHKQVQNINSYGCRPLEIGRKILDLRGWKARAEHTTLEIYIPSNKELSHLPRVQKENDPNAQPTAKSFHSQRS
jgi:hypothetical protein